MHDNLLNARIRSAQLSGALLAKQIWQPGCLGVLRGVGDGFSEEARTRGVASLTFVRFAFVNGSFSQKEKCRQFWDVRKLESV